MTEYTRRPPGLRIKQIWFAEKPYDVDKCDIVEFWLCKQDVKLENFTQSRWCSIVIDLSQGEERIWGNISEKFRAGIRKAKTEGVIVQRNQNVSGFLTLHKEFRVSKDLKAATYPTDFIEKNCLLLTAEYNGELIAGILYLVDGSKMLGLLSASKRLEVEKEKIAFISNANKLLWWEAIKYGLENGVIDFDMGGYDDVADRNVPVKGVAEFKRRFGGQVVHYFNYTRIYSIKAKVGMWVIRHLGRFSNYFYNRNW
jgi:lipid II:glycine glycyltransferase (peptidoglycan interpeptide bridge formation enzyme)